MVIEREFGGMLALEDVHFPPPTVNHLATLLAHAMQRSPQYEDRQRPRTIYLRDRPQWQELLPHLRQLGIEVVLTDDLPRFDEAVLEDIQKSTPKTADEIKAALRKPFPERKRTSFDDAMNLMEWSDGMFKGAYPSRKVPVPLYDPMTVVPIHLAMEELEAILTKTEIAKTKTLRPRLEAMTTEGKAINLDINDWSRIVLALCGPKVKEEQVRRHLLEIATRIANQLAETLGIDGPAGKES